MKKIRKNLTVLILTFSILWMHVTAGASPARQLRITVTADTHFQCAADLGEFSDDYTENLLEPALFGYASTQGQMNYESEAILAAMLKAFCASDSECLLIAGDLTCGKRRSHLAFADYLRQAEEKSGKRIFVIVGNHDCAAESSGARISMEEFREIYADFGYNEALSRHAGSASYAVDLNEVYRLLAVDSCIYGEDEGQIGKDVFRWIREQTAQAARDGKTLVAMMHHSLLPHYELQPMIDAWQFYAGWFADHGIRTVLTGHIHANDISASVSDRGNTVYDVQTGALIASPNTYRTLTLCENRVDVQSSFITEIDPALLPDRLSEAQKTLLKEDFSAYAKNYFVSGVCKWLNRNVGSVDRIARWFRLKEGSAAYEAARRIMRRLGAAVGQDIYENGNGSIASTLAPYGISVPQSDYRKPYQVAAELMYGFFHGDEPAAENTADEKLLLTCLEGAVLTAMKDTVDASSLRALSAAMYGGEAAAKLSSLPVSVLMRKTAGKLALALLQTLAGGFVDDYSAPDDLNVTLTFTEEGITAPLHLPIRLLRLFREFWRHICLLCGKKWKAGTM